MVDDIALKRNPMSAIPNRAIPSRTEMVAFAAKATLLRLARMAREQLGGAKQPRHGKSDRLVDAPIVAHISSPLWNGLTGEQDRVLTAGKIHNLRLAARALNGIEIPAGAVMSFWQQVGRATRRRGFVKGRELREGCLIASVGGGLCQLSNALYEAALQAGFEIVERHAHSRTVPGSRAEMGRDATVFWNYVDLRFRSRDRFRVEAQLTSDSLEIVLKTAPSVSPSKPITPLAPAATAHDCTSCGQTACHRHNPDQPLSAAHPTAWLVDACWPEFDALFQSRSRPSDALFLPTRRFGKTRYGWARGLCKRETKATYVTFRRSLALRSAPAGAALQKLTLSADRRLAEHYAARLSPLDTHLVISQNLLAHLWQLGVLQGRSFEVLMERLPLVILQARLDEAAGLYPQSPTLADFRAPSAIVEAETAALALAERFYTPHTEIAALHPERTDILPWALPKGPLGRRGGRVVLFPASTLGRKGAYVLRDALDGLDIDLVVSGRAIETTGFWGSLAVRTLEGPRPNELAAVVLPALVEHQPRVLLWALESGIPVIATAACGILPRPGLIVVPQNDPSALRAALEKALLPQRLDEAASGRSFYATLKA